MSGELVTVRVRDCACPDTPHADGDEVYMVPTVGIELGIATEFDMKAAGEYPRDRQYDWLMARWAVTFVQFGAVGWNFIRRDDKGNLEDWPFDVTVLLNDYTLGKPVADKGADLYAPTVMAPFFRAAEKQTKARRPPRSSNGSTTSETSVSPVSIQSRRKPSSGPSTAGPQSRTAP